jgi:hypothetical protein
MNKHLIQIKMPRPVLDFRSGSKENYIDFCKKNVTILLSYKQWVSIVYGFNELFREYVLETGERVKLPFGIGEFSIIKKKRVKRKEVNGREIINLPIDWQKTKEKGKYIYNFNFHTEGYFFGWRWHKCTARFTQADLWYFKPCRNTSRLLAHYLKTDNKYQYLYNECRY